MDDIRDQSIPSSHLSSGNAKHLLPLGARKGHFAHVLLKWADPFDCVTLIYGYFSSVYYVNR